MTDSRTSIVDDDTTDDYLDLPVSTYGPEGKTMAQIDADREAAGLPPVEVKKIPLPPLTDH